jgi:hypothetical protein
MIEVDEVNFLMLKNIRKITGMFNLKGDCIMDGDPYFWWDKKQIIRIWGILFFYCCGRKIVTP